MKLAIVTGSNKGVGFGVVERLARYFSADRDWHIYLTARKEELGLAAVESLQSEGLSVKFHQLDICDKESRTRLYAFVKENYPDGINILVNNAGIAYTVDSTAPFSEQARVTLNTNYYANVDMCLEFLPLMAPNSRLVNITSMSALFCLRTLGSDLYKKTTSPMTLEELNSLMQDFISRAETGNHTDAGWPDSAYGVSKLGFTKATYILAEKMKNDPRQISINACCPGYVDTDMTRHKGTKTIFEGSDTPFYLATLPIDAKEPYGKMISNRQVVPWSK